MKKESLFAFLNSGILDKNFVKELEEEVILYISDIQSKKGVKKIYGEYDIDYSFDRERLLVLLKTYLQNQILEWDLEYILNYIELSFDFEDEKVEEVIFNFSDPYLNFSITSANIVEAVAFLMDTITQMNLKENKELGLRGNYKSIFLNNPLAPPLQKNKNPKAR